MQLRKRRIELGLSQKQLGELIGCSQRVVSGYETGQKEMPDHVLVKIERVLYPEEPQLVYQADEAIKVWDEEVGKTTDALLLKTIFGLIVAVGIVWIIYVLKGCS